jgi:biopolymer transport protein ExbD
MSIDAIRGAEHDEAALSTAINTTPLVDVMLVLLIIFLVTIPVISKTVPLELPNYRNIVTVTKPENIVIHVDSNENLYWNNEVSVPTDLPNIKYRLVKAEIAANAAHKPFPEVHIRGDKDVRFEAVGRVIAVCQQVGILKVGFLTQPPPNALPPGMQ